MGSGLANEDTVIANLAGWGVGGRGNEGYCGTDVRASISKSTPFIYLVFEKNGPIYILDRMKC